MINTQTGQGRAGQDRKHRISYTEMRTVITKPAFLTTKTDILGHDVGGVV